VSSLLQGCVVLECTDNCKRHHAATPIKTNSSALSLTTTAVGVWHDRAGVQRGPGVPYSQIRILARARWQLFHLRGILSRGGLKPHVVLAGDNALLEDAEEARFHLAALLATVATRFVHRLMYQEEGEEFMQGGSTPFLMSCVRTDMHYILTCILGIWQKM